MKGSRHYVDSYLNEMSFILFEDFIQGLSFALYWKETTFLFSTCQGKSYFLQENYFQHILLFDTYKNLEDRSKSKNLFF